MELTGLQSPGISFVNHDTALRGALTRAAARDRDHGARQRGHAGGASGKVPAAIHVTPEALDGGGIARVRDGDMMLVDAGAGRVEARVGAVRWAARANATADLVGNDHGCGRVRFAQLRQPIGGAEDGALLPGGLAA